MAAYRNPVDIANRALQHCGQTRISDTLGFTEDSKQASETASAYDKVRQAELRANVWRFSTKKTLLRAIDTTTLILAPAMWASTTTYFPGAIVSDAANTLWICNFPDNLNNAPGSSYFWDIYTGPLSVSKWVSGTSYFAGELVWTAPGDGTYRVFVSLQNANSDNPNVPDQWSSTAIYAKDQVVQFYPAWAVGTTYAAGATVTYTDGLTYTSLSAGNVGHVPTNTTYWILTPQTGSSTTAAILPWSATTTYSIGSFADQNGTQYLSIVNSNLNLKPSANPSSWKALTLGTKYASLIDLNINQEPDLSPALFALATTYAISAQVIASDGYIYTSVANGNVGNNPISDAGVHWTNTNVLGAWTSVLNFGSGGSTKWLSIAPVALTDLFIIYPLGSGPSSQASTRNIFRLPANYLRVAPQDPKAGSTSALGAPSGLAYTDWNYEGDYIVSSDIGPIVFRFVADIYDVTAMDPMFCEALAARLGMAVCQQLTQSTAKLSDIQQQYTHFMSLAARANGIEIGAVEPPEDDYVTCRL